MKVFNLQVGLEGSTEKEAQEGRMGEQWEQAGREGGWVSHEVEK